MDDLTPSEPDPEHADPVRDGDLADPGLLPVLPVDLRDYVAFSEEVATRVRVFASEHLAMDLWCIEPRQATGALHEPERDITYTVLGGRSWFVTDEGEVGLDPMGAMLVRAGVVHGIDNRAPDPLIVVAVGSPPGVEPAAPPVAHERQAVRLANGGAGPLRRRLQRFFGGE